MTSEEMAPIQDVKELLAELKIGLDDAEEKKEEIEGKLNDIEEKKKEWFYENLYFFKRL